MKQAVIIVVVLALAGLGFVLTREDKKDNTPSSTSNTQQTPTPSPSSEQTEDNTPTNAKEITYTDDGFSPNSLTVKSGDTVTIKNSSSGPLELDSDPHPQHTANPELNVGSVPSGQSKSFTVITKGEHGYHNHLNSRDTGILVVE